MGGEVVIPSNAVRCWSGLVEQEAPKPKEQVESGRSDLIVGAIGIDQVDFPTER